MKISARQREALRKYHATMESDLAEMAESGTLKDHMAGYRACIALFHNIVRPALGAAPVSEGDPEPCDYCKQKGREWSPDCEKNKAPVAAEGDPVPQGEQP